MTPFSPKGDKHIDVKFIPVKIDEFDYSKTWQWTIWVCLALWKPWKKPNQIVCKFSKGEASYALKHEAYIYQMLGQFDTEGFPGLSRFVSNIKEKGQQNR